jgi:hypothetical protein
MHTRQFDGYRNDQPSGRALEVGKCTFVEGLGKGMFAYFEGLHRFVGLREGLVMRYR